MNENCKANYESTKNINVNVAKVGEKENVSTSCLEIQVDELSYGGISFKGLRCHADATITDENVHVQCDTVTKLFGQLIGKFGDALVDNIKVNTERQRQRIKDADREFEAEHKYDQENHEADLKYKEEQTRYYASQAKYYDEQAAAEKARRIREEQQTKKNNN